MNKDAICELMDLRADISTVNVTPYVMKPVINRLNSIIIDLMEMDEGRKNETCCACEDCPAMKKVDDLIEATKLREWLEETASEAALEAERMARGKRARGGADL